MKVVAVFFVAISLVLLVACGSEAGSKPDIGDQQPNATVDPVDVSIDPGYNDAIDFSPAANPAEREQAYFQVAAGLADPFTPKPNQNLVFDLVWEEPIDGNARIRITGMFEENGEWVEKYADFRITRTAVGNWILKNEVKFDKTDDQESLDYQEQKRIEDEIKRQEKLAELTRIQEAFDSVTIEFVNTEYLPSQSEKPGVGGFTFHLLVSNPMPESYDAVYSIEWVENLSTSVSEKCPRDSWGSMEPQTHKAEEELELQPLELGKVLEFSPSSSRIYQLYTCDDLIVDLIDLQVVEINGMTRQKLTEGIIKNQ